MKCSSVNYPDCRFLEKHDDGWDCDLYKWVVDDPGLGVCLGYEPLVNESFKEFDEWRDRCIRLGLYSAVVTLIALVIFVWMFT